ncbi:uncharacterized protein LACBIDRAFT_331907 [Laccaria bicolor S238N-H82]|uniref:Predicted protein n=1 Tax=Laccaria bicolor (strain S238N-H82 / ATCC MYA-4686) TaxID=486041 RepID=B0DR02_LACBS|nr:uncharacterized protein LACBIDRAFT_331907 [Laccaria bicolor S238N-H82]EDR02979.1 predicted protein [Laccaria bicolor S238N-H82]|eukprot:XP_001886402.1 predicted protein [Laccaria bicolor S238N-H82]
MVVNAEHRVPGLEGGVNHIDLSKFDKSLNRGSEVGIGDINKDGGESIGHVRDEEIHVGSCWFKSKCCSFSTKQDGNICSDIKIVGLCMSLTQAMQLLYFPHVPLAMVLIKYSSSHYHYFYYAPPLLMQQIMMKKSENSSRTSGTKCEDLLQWNTSQKTSSGGFKA